MTEFNWYLAPPYGTCIICGASASPQGFVDCIADTVIRDQRGELVGVVDIVLCSDCVHSIGRYFGMASRAETEAFAYREHELVEALEKSKGETDAWHERYEALSEFLEYRDKKGESDFDKEE